MATAPALAEACQFGVQAGEPGTELVVDLTAVTFIDARGLDALVEAAGVAGPCGSALHVVGCPPCLMRLVELTHTRDALNLK